MDTKVRTFLIDLARHRTDQTITYQHLSNECNLRLDMQGNPNDRKKMAQILGEISTFEFSHKRPLLSSLVVRVGDNYEGDGFFKLAEQLGFGDWQKLRREGIFEIEQMNKCIAFWTNNSNYAAFK